MAFAITFYGKISLKIPNFAILVYNRRANNALRFSR